MRFGVDVDRQVLNWWEGYKSTVRQRYGDGANVMVYVLDPTRDHEWRMPLAGWLYRLVSSAEDLDGLMTNIAGKLQFCLRTGLNSVEAEKRFDLLEPGDFPWEGAGFYRGYVGGASGLNKESDWRVFCEVVDQVIVYRAAAAARAVEASRAKVPDWKYLDGDLAELEAFHHPGAGGR